MPLVGDRHRGREPNAVLHLYDDGLRRPHVHPRPVHRPGRQQHKKVRRGVFLYIRAFNLYHLISNIFDTTTSFLPDIVQSFESVNVPVFVVAAQFLPLNIHSQTMS